MGERDIKPPRIKEPPPQEPQDHLPPPRPHDLPVEEPFDDVVDKLPPRET